MDVSIAALMTANIRRIWGWEIIAILYKRKVKVLYVFRDHFLSSRCFSFTSGKIYPQTLEPLVSLSGLSLRCLSRGWKITWSGARSRFPRLSSSGWGCLVKSGNLWQVWFRGVWTETAEAPLSNPSNQTESSYFSNLTCITEVWGKPINTPQHSAPRQLTLTSEEMGFFIFLITKYGTWGQTT